MARVVVVLAQAEVYQHRADIPVLLLFEHYVVGLDVEVADAVAVQQLHGLHHRLHQPDGLGLGQWPVLLDIVAQALAAQVFHDVIGRVVGLEDLVETYDVGVREADFLKSQSLVDKVLARVLHAVARRVGIYYRGVGLPLAVVAHKEFLEREIHLHADAADLHLRFGAVGDAEASVAQGLRYGVCSLVTLKLKADGQGIICFHIKSFLVANLQRFCVDSKWTLNNIDEMVWIFDEVREFEGGAADGADERSRCSRRDRQGRAGPVRHHGAGSG